MPELLTVREAAQRLGLEPRKLSDAFYTGRLHNDCCILIGSRRAIPAPMLPRIAERLDCHSGVSQ
jgi:hypothetical protein